MMEYWSRRDFLKTSTVFIAASFASPLWHLESNTPQLAFSTLGCPDWDFRKIIDFAAANSYSGIELRGLLREMDLTKCPEFSKEKLPATLSLMKDRQLKFVDLGSSATMHFADTTERKKNLDEGRRFIDLAQQLGCPYIRVFPNNFPKEQQKQATMDLIAAGLAELGTYAAGSGVMVLMETHGDMVYSTDIVKVMQAAANDHTGLVWDITNMWTVTHEPPAEVYGKLKKYIHHTHIKDAALVDGKVQYRLLGKGEVPIFEAIDLLSKNGYKGYYSFEWEKLWHPEIAEPEIALADYPNAMKQHFTK
jgi:sugar phosphate isomerase/epimerase